MRLRSSFETKVLFAFGMAVLVAILLCALTWRIAGDASEAAQQVSRTEQVLHGLAHVRAATLQIELSTQSYRISGDTDRLIERDAEIAQRALLLSLIQQLTIDHPAQQARWQELHEVMGQRLALALKIETLRKTQGADAAGAFVATAPLDETRARTYRLLDAMEEEERQRLTERTGEQQKTDRLMRQVGAAAATLLLTLLVATYALIRRQLREAAAGRLQLEDSEERLSITLRCIGDAVLATDVAGQVTRLNPVAERITGWSLDEALGRPVEQVVCIADALTHQALTGLISGVLATGQAQARERDVVLLARDGTERPISISATPKRDLAGLMRGAVLVLRDVTIERQAQRTIEVQNEWLAERVQERTAQLRESEAHLRSVTSNVPALIAYVGENERYVYVNQQYHDRFAPERSNIVGCTVREILGEARYAIAAPLIAKVLQGQSQTYDWQPFPGVWQVFNYVPQRDATEHVTGYYVLGADITERKQAEEKIHVLNRELEQRVHELERVSRALRTLSAGNRTMLRASHEDELLHSMCQAIVSNGGYGMAILWYRADDEFQSLRPMGECNYPGGLAALRLLKVTWSEGEFSGGVAATAVRTGKTNAVADMRSDPGYAPWRQHLAGHRSALACPLRVGGEVIGALTIYDAEPDIFDADEVTLLTESADDLAFGIATLRARAEQQRVSTAMHQLTHFDALTGLANAAQFAETLDAVIGRSHRDSLPFAALQTNIDRLREVNDALGFSQGDKMLQEFGARLQAVAPKAALVARLRGDEFAVLIPGGDRRAAETLTAKIETFLALPFEIADIPIHVSSKTGIALFPEHGATPHDFLRHMDIALHQAKQRGARHAFFDAARNQDQPSRLNLASELKRAIEGDQLRLYLQPKVDFRSRRLCGAEALVRWMHPERGLVPPLEFIGLAEHIGLIKPLTEWMLASVLQLNRQWSNEGLALPIAVNLSARNLHDEDLLDRIRQMLSTFETAPGLLELEITESTVMEDPKFALGVLNDLRALGIPLYIDDFGTGYSSLSYLQRLPVEYIKIDQSFVRDMATSKDSAAIVRSTIDLTHDLGRQIVAEGVETQADWDQLAAMGCDLAQGYFIAKPMPVVDFLAWRQHIKSAAIQ